MTHLLIVAGLLAGSLGCSEAPATVNQTRFHDLESDTMVLTIRVLQQRDPSQTP
jgi:hypothetical protein